VDGGGVDVHSTLAHGNLKSRLHDDTIFCIDAEKDLDHPVVLVQFVDCYVVDGFVTFNDFRILAWNEGRKSLGRPLRYSRTECSQVLRAIEKEGAIDVGDS